MVKIPDKLSGIAFTPTREHNNLVEVVRWLLSNAIVAIGPGMELLSLPQGRGVGLAESGVIYAKITGSASADSPARNRYTYSWSEVIKSTAGYGGWADKSGGRTGTNNGYNLIEDNNNTTGTLGNGVATTNLVGTYTLKPVPADTVVALRVVRTADGTTEYWFSYENGVDGACT